MNEKKREREKERYYEVRQTKRHKPPQLNFRKVFRWLRKHGEKIGIVIIFGIFAWAISWLVQDIYSDLGLIGGTLFIIVMPIVMAINDSL